MNFSFDDILSSLSILISFLLVIYLLGAKSKKKTSNYLFAAYFAIFLIDSAAGFFSYYLYPTYPSIAFLLSGLVFLQPPLLFLYACSIIYSDFKIKNTTLLHTIPYVVINLIFIPDYYLVSTEEKLKLLEEGHRLENWQVPLDYAGMHLSILVYLIASFYVIFRYRKLLKENYSNPDLLNQKWLLLLFGIFSVLSIIATYKNYTVFTQAPSQSMIMTITNFTGLVFVCWILLKAMHKPELFKGVETKLQLVRKIVNEEKKIKTLEQERPEIARLKTFMKEKEPFLDASLSMHGLATMLDIPPRELSVLINHHLNQNFFDFVNEYRIEKAKNILQNPDKKDLTILEILYEVGFNSKSSFNTAFKKYTNFTPTEYRKKCLKSVA